MTVRPGAGGRRSRPALLAKEPTKEEIDFFAGEIMNSPGWVRCASMRDHTNKDWRDILPTIKVRALVTVGRKSQVFDWRGSAYVGEHIPGAKTVFFENSGHMLFYEEAAKFNRVVSEFVNE